MNRFPTDFANNLTGFGGDRGKSQADHRSLRKKTPVILVHGNGGHSAHPRWGMEQMKSFLIDAGYQECEIWAMDHLGENNNAGDLNEPHRNHIAAFRVFVDRVRDYLDVEKIDFIAHSLGCGMVNAYMRGLQTNGTWDSSQNRVHAVGTFVSLAGATYGLGANNNKEFGTGTAFEKISHQLDGKADDTPHGLADASLMEAPVDAWKVVTTTDDNHVAYVALIAKGDFVDAQKPDTGRREGAALIKHFNLGGGLDGHEKIIKSHTVFDTFKTYLNRYPPGPRVVITVDKDSGSYGSALQVGVAAVPIDSSVGYQAERVSKRIEAGYLVSTVTEKRIGTLMNGQSLVLSPDGLWEVVFSASGGEPVKRTYGVNIVLPEVTILTDNAKKFTKTLEVAATTTGGTLYHSTDGEHWLTGATLTIERTATVWFVAVDESGAASPSVKRQFERELDYEDKAIATLTAHFIAGRLSVTDYVATGFELGFNAVVTLYKVDGKWVRQLGAPRVSVAAMPMRAPRMPRAAVVSADVESGEHIGGFDVTLTARGPVDARTRVYYTTDGSDPSDGTNPARASFRGEKTFAIRGNGPHSILCFVQDTQGNRGFESFAWSIDDQQYPETGISPSLGGTYAGCVAVMLHPSEPCQWTRYTTDGSDPSDTSAVSYTPGQPIVIEQSCVLSFCSKDLAGNVEPAKSAAFTITPAEQHVVFDNVPGRDGCVKAVADGTGAQVATARSLAVGTSHDGLEMRSILHFDTSQLPDNAVITRAHLEVGMHTVRGEPWGTDGVIEIDIRNGYFGSSRALQAADWGADASAEGIATIARFDSGVKESTAFSAAGCKAINRAGVTQLRLRLTPAPEATGQFVALKPGPAARLVVDYYVEAAEQYVEAAQVAEPEPR